MSFQQFLTILRARKLIIFFVFTLTVSAGAAITSIMPKTYSASSSVVVNFTGVDLITGDKVYSQLSTQTNIIRSLNVALKVVDMLQLYTEQRYVQQFYSQNKGKGDIRSFIAKQLMDRLSVSATPGNNVIRISYSSTSPEFAASVVNTYAEAYIGTNLELKIDPSKRTAQWFEGQVVELKKDLIKKQKVLVDYQKSSGNLVDQKFDFESAQLARLSSQLFEAESELFDLRSQLSEVSADRSNFTDVVFDEYLDGIRTSLLSARLELSQLASSVSTNHPDYIVARSKVIGLKSSLKKEIEIAYVRFKKSIENKEKRIAGLKQAISEQRQVILNKNEVNNVLSNLINDVEIAEKALNSAINRLNQTSLESRSSESDISILTRAPIPTTHSKPKFIVNMVLSVVLGLFLALMIAFLAELLNRKARTEDDILISVGLPILGELRNASSLKKKQNIA